jgi:hypothetical protein
MNDTTTLNPDDLRQFTGSEQWYRHALVRDVLYTDGAQYLAERGGAYWLLDEIALANRYENRVMAESFQLWKLTVSSDCKATLACEDGNGREVFSKAIEYTDFPLKEVKLYFTDNVIMLPSEY